MAMVQVVVCCYLDEFMFVHITVGDEPLAQNVQSNNPICTAYEGPATVEGELFQFECDNGPKLGKYVGVQINRVRVAYLSISEIAIFGPPVEGNFIARYKCIWTRPEI